MTRPQLNPCDTLYETVSRTLFPIHAHEPSIADASKWPNFLEQVIKRIHSLRALLQTQDESPPALVEVVETITAELFKYLKTHPEALHQLNPRQFEELIAEILASYGWSTSFAVSSASSST